MDDPVTAKAAAICLLGVVRLVSGLSPLVFAGSLRAWGARSVSVATSLALCFGGGVLLASCMLHMIPEFVVCCGFFLVYFVEEVVQFFTKPTGLRSMEAEIRISGKVGPGSSDCGYGQSKKEVVDLQGNTRHILVLSALSLHSVLEGLALGLQPSMQSVWMIFTAVSVHAVAVLFSIGLELVSEGTAELQVVACMTLLALSSPLGGCLGLLATAGGQKAHAGTVVTLQGLAAGAVLYVTFFEVLEKERRKGGFIRLVVVMLGFLAMAGFQALSGDHNHLKSVARTQRENGTKGS